MVPETASTKKRLTEENDLTDSSKRVKTDSPKLRKSREICPKCKQFVTDNLKMITFPQVLDEKNRSMCDNELQLMTDASLRIVTDTNEAIDDDYNAIDDIEIKITQFSFYNEHCGHLVPLESLDNKTALMTGYAIKLTSSDSDFNENEALPVQNIVVGYPWMFNLDDGTPKNLVGVSSFNEPSLHYYLDEPSELYRETFLTYKELSYLVKAVQNILTENPESDYESFLSELNDFDVPEDVGILTEDTLLKHVQFVFAHCKSLDNIRDDDEVALLDTKALLQLQEQTGIKTPKPAKPLVRRRAEKQEPKNLNVKATTTAIIRQIFEGSLFADTIRSEEENAKLAAVRTKKHCGKCPKCVAPDCGTCAPCLDMKKFGGSGKSKQRCLERVCLNFADVDSSSDSEVQIKRPKKSSVSKIFSLNETDSIVFPDINDISIVTKHRISSKLQESDIVKRFENRKIYHSFGTVLKSGDFVTVHCRTIKYGIIFVEGCIRYFIETNDGKVSAHISWMQPANESILGVTADAHEFFFNGQCGNVDVNKLQRNSKMTYFKVSDNWNTLGDEDHSENLPKSPFVTQWYDDSTYRLYYPKVMHDPAVPEFCPDCLAKVPDLEVPPFETFTDEGHAILTKIVRRGVEFSTDDDVFVYPDAYKFAYKLDKPKPVKTSTKKDAFDPLYPEKRRKTEYIKGSNEKVSVPYKVARIVKILVNVDDIAIMNDGITLTDENITLVIRKFYRPEDTGKTGSEDAYGTRRLYWSDEEVTIRLDKVHDKCLVLCDLDYKSVTTLDSYLENGPKRFFFEEAFNAKDGSLEIVGRSSQKLNVTSGRKTIVDLNKLSPTMIPEPHPTIGAPLKSMDLFAGCGGLSRGFHDSGVADTKWAVEFDTHAAKAFKKNFPDAIVYEKDCNVLLDALIQGRSELDKQPLPKKGDVELLCGGPPCQGFSGMNRFTKSEYTKFRNSLVVTFFGFVDVLRPKFVVMENVRAFVSYKQNMVLKLTLRALQRLGYQCSFGILQAGSYGVPQTRRRAFIIAAAPGEILPYFPEPTHCFSGKGLSLSVTIDTRRYEMPESFTTGSAPYSTVTVEQACSDLPVIRIGNEKDFELKYKCEPNSYFQKLVRKNSPTLFDHMTRSLHPLIAARIERIPKTPGSDWRDLINVSCQQKYIDKKGVEHVLNIEKLRYEFGPKDSAGNKLGVCSCNESRPCDYRNNKQENTLIPWCLPHTADRHNNWAGLYGRISWDGFFSTVVTNPEPMGKQGRVLHPEQDRIVSIREHARAQGFPDCHRFYGDVLRKYRQVGNAVPPPLANAIGLQIKACLADKQNAIEVVKKKI